jgi:hypothetical protein
VAEAEARGIRELLLVPARWMQLGLSRTNMARSVNEVSHPGAKVRAFLPVVHGKIDMREGGSEGGGGRRNGNGNGNGSAGDNTICVRSGRILT